jgi:hypothetical protein
MIKPVDPSHFLAVTNKYVILAKVRFVVIAKNVVVLHLSPNPQSARLAAHNTFHFVIGDSIGHNAIR